MTRTNKGGLFVALVSSVLFIVMVTVFVSPRDPAIRNQAKVVRLLAKARPSIPSEASQIESVILGDGTTLLPERDQVAAGYVLRAHVRAATFTIGAEPIRRGVTGLFSYFRDENGVMRFEMNGRIANAGSPTLNQPVQEESR